MRIEEQFDKGISYIKQKQKEAIWLIEIATLERDIRSNYEEIGKLYYTNQEEGKYSYYIQRIQSLEKDIAAIKKKLNELKESKEKKEVN